MIINYLKISTLCFTVCIALSLVGCGLERYITQLRAPDPIYNVGVQFFEFKKITVENTVENTVDAKFQGFEIYYRLYEEAETIEFVNTFEELAIKGYRRVYSKDDRVGAFSKPKPLIEVTDTDPSPLPTDLGDLERLFTMRVDFAQITDPFPKIYNEEPPVLDQAINLEEIRREVTYDVPFDDEYKRFSEFIASDADISALDWSSFEIKGKLVLYVLSYGKNVLTNTDLYSEPVWLGEITRDFVP